MGKQVLICTDCRTRIPFDDGQWPDSCPGCGKDTSLPDTDEVALPAFISFRKAAVDQTYRDIERTSEVRAQQAADALGVPVSEMSGLKITNLNDRRDAEIAAISVPVNPITQQMDLMRARGMPTGFGGAVDFGGVQSGALPNAGAKTRVRLQNILPPIASAPLPLEVTQPGYRRRA